MAKPLYKNSAFYAILIIAILFFCVVLLGVYEAYRAIERAFRPENEGDRQEPAKNGSSWHGYMLSVKEFEKCALNVGII